jgi:hypothetical protein
LCTLPDGAGFSLETVVLWKDSIEVPDSNRLGIARHFLGELVHVSKFAGGLKLLKELEQP